MALRNMGISLALLSWVLPTICESLAYGMTNVISNNENGTLRTPPVVLNVIRIPLATPRFSAGTEPITELILGGPNIALPRPNKTRLIKTALYEDF